MIKPIKYAAVNWVDGMKISEKHFIQHQNFIIDTVRDASSLGINNFNYGLLPQPYKKDEENRVFEIYNTATNDVQLIIHHCSAVTAAGLRIELSDYKVNIKSLVGEAKVAKATKEVNNTTNKSDEGYYILIAVNPYERIPLGDIDPEETPPRHPFTTSKYIVDVMPITTYNEGQINANSLVIGKISFIGESMSADENFIPPCVNLYSFKKLLVHYADFAKSIAILQDSTKVIISKIIEKGQNSSLASNIKLLCTTIVNHLGNTYFAYRNLVLNQPPIYMIEIFSQLAFHFNSARMLIPEREKEEMQNYIYEWSNVAPHNLDTLLSAVAEINYNHNNCGEHLKDIKLLLDNLSATFKKLSELDYIGQRKENIIVNEQQIDKNNSKNKTGWSVLD